MSDFNKKAFKKKQIITLLMSFCIAIIGILSGVFAGVFNERIPDDTITENSGSSNSQNDDNVLNNSSDQENTSQDGDEDYGDNLILSKYVDDNNAPYLLCYDNDNIVHIPVENQENIVIPNEVVKISEGAFYNCNNLISIIIPNSVTAIAQGAFEGCSNLKEITIPFVGTHDGGEEKFGSIFINALYDVNDYVPASLKKVTINGGEYITDGDFKDCSNLTTIIICDSVTSIGSNAFNGCSSLSSITIGDNVDGIAYNAFYDCNSLLSINIPDSVTSIGDKAFFNCTNLKNVTLGENVSDIGYYAFYNCKNLISIKIPNSVTFIGGETFAGCSNLTEISLPFVGMSANATTESATTLFGYIFGANSYEGSKKTRQYYSTYAYQDYYIPSSLKSVEITGKNILYRAFNNCQNITSIIISDSVVSIGSYAFSGCSNLKIYCKATSKPSGWASNWNSDGCPVEWGYTGS